jgi:23S rRNA (adenine-N6)-dimethyltransferase
VLDADVRAGELVVDIGAGTGHISAALRRAGAHVLAIELDAAFAAALRRRFGDDPAVCVVEADAREASLPRDGFRVVANLPFAGSGAILDRLLDPHGALQRADLVVEWGLARKRAETWPATSRGIVASAYFEVWIERRLTAGCFEPRPSVDAAVLVLRRRERPRVPLAQADAFARFVRAGFAAHTLRAGLHDRLPPRRLRRLADELAFARDAAPRTLDGRQWVSLFLESSRRA